MALAAPLILFSVLTSLYPSPGIFLRVIDARPQSRRWLSPCIGARRSTICRVGSRYQFALGLGVLCLYLAFIGEYDLVLRLAHSGISLMTAMLVLVTYRRWSPGVIFTAAGLLMWSSPMVVDFLLHQGDPLMLIFLRAVNLMKVVTAVGMIVLVTEDELIRNETAQRRDRRVRAEMEQYSKLAVLASPNRDFGIDFDHVCEVITSASRFGQAAILLRSVDQQFRIVGQAGMEGALAGALDAMGQRLTPENAGSLPEPRPFCGERQQRGVGSAPSYGARGRTGTAGLCPGACDSDGDALARDCMACCC